MSTAADNLLRRNPDTLTEPKHPTETERAVETFRETGYCVWPELLKADFVSELRESYSARINEKVRRFNLGRVSPSQVSEPSTTRVLNDFTPKGGNHDVNRWNMHLPSETPFFDDRLIANPRLLPVVEALMGEDCVCYLIASDTPFPGATMQGVHQDFSRFSIAINVPLVDCTEENAPLEVWPGTHQPQGRANPDGFNTMSWMISAEGMQRVVKEIPSRRLLLKAGSAIMRDHRLVHRGTANLSSQPRPMLSLYFVRPRAVPYRWVADLGAKFSLRIRRWGRGNGEDIARPGMLNLGNMLGRIVEEYSLTDRDYRRAIPSELWTQLSPQARQLLRYAVVEGLDARSGTIRGTRQFLKGWFKAMSGFLSAALLSRPRRPDEEEH